MKKIITIVIVFLINTIAFCQAPEKMSYQAVLRDVNNVLVVNQQVGMQISILQNQTAVYVETQTPTTNSNGLVTLEIGTGSVVLGTFSSIDWSSGVYFIKTEIDPSGSNSYSVTGTNQILSVPYALHSKTSENGISAEQAALIQLNSEKYSNLYSSTFLQNEKFLADIQMNIIYGQSLAIGGSTISEEEFYTSLSFQTGTLFSTNENQTISEFNNEELQESKFISLVPMTSVGSGINGRMISKKWNELIRDENGKDLNSFNFNLMGFAAGRGGSPWSFLTKRSQTTQFIDVQFNTMPYALSFGSSGQEGRAYLTLMQGVYFANKFAKSQGKTFNVTTLSWVQGESSADKYNTVEQYYKKLEDIFNDINQDVKTLTGQTNDVQFIIYQNASFAIYQTPTSPQYEVGRYTEGVPLACLKIARDKDNVHLGTPLYPFSPPQSATDKIHLQNTGYALMSSMFGIQGKRVVTDGKPTTTFYPKENQITSFSNGTNWFTRIPFDVPVKPLILDTDGVSGVNMRGHGLQPNYGFSILNNAGDEIITDVKLSASDAITITTSENPTGLDLTYARTGVFGGGNLRDNQGATITTTFNKITYRCDNWAPFFRIKL